jgi:DNA-binding Xre family transcriptional regulator
MSSDQAYDKAVGASIRSARHQKDMRQSTLAAKHDLSSGALSRVESGDLTAISKERLEAILHDLEIKADALPRTALAYCPGSGCLTSSAVVQWKNTVVFVPMPVEVKDAGAKLHCHACGSELNTTCECGAAFEPGAICCKACGLQYCKPIPFDSLDEANRCLDSHRANQLAYRELYEHKFGAAKER